MSVIIKLHYFKHLWFIVFFFLCNCLAYSQDTTTKNKQVILKYYGGEAGHSGNYLTLYSDSSYIYSGWNDAGPSWKYEGTFKRADSTITLYPKYYTYNTHRKKLTAPIQALVYKMRANGILMYTKEEENLAEFYTLYKEENSK